MSAAALHLPLGRGTMGQRAATCALLVLFLSWASPSSSSSSMAHPPASQGRQSLVRGWSGRIPAKCAHQTISAAAAAVTVLDIRIRVRCTVLGVCAAPCLRAAVQWSWRRCDSWPAVSTECEAAADMAGVGEKTSQKSKKSSRVPRCGGIQGEVPGLLGPSRRERALCPVQLLSTPGRVAAALSAAVMATTTPLRCRRTGPSEGPRWARGNACPTRRRHRRLYFRGDDGEQHHPPPQPVPSFLTGHRASWYIGSGGHEMPACARSLAFT